MIESPDRRRFMGTVSLAGLAGLPLAVAASTDRAAPQEQGAAAQASSGVTRAQARYVVSARYADIPAPVRKEAQRTLLNWTGCAVDGSRHETLDVALAALAPFLDLCWKVEGLPNVAALAAAAVPAA